MQELKLDSNIAVGLDIGTTTLRIVVAEKDEYGRLKVLGKGCVSSNGLKRAKVVNINKAVDALKAAVAEVECESSLVIHGVNIALSGAHVHCVQSSSEISINQTGVVNESDVNRFLEKAKANIQNLDINQEIIHVIPQEFIVDDQDKLLDPIGMAGMTMKGRVYIVVGLKTKIRNIRQCVERAGLKINNLTYKPNALGLAVIKEREKKGVVAVIDIGGGTTEVAIYLGGAIHFSEVINVAANDITLDIAHGLQVLEDEAEVIKIKYGCADSRLCSGDEDIIIDFSDGYSKKTYPKSALTFIIEARMMEILELVRDTLMLSGYYDDINAGAIITGGGSLLTGVVELARFVLGLDVRIGYPEGVSGGIQASVNNPMDATVMGLVAYVYQDNLSCSQRFASTVAIPENLTSAGCDDVSLAVDKNKTWKKIVDGFQGWWAKL
ncbi:MAG: cell division protein FtsA [Chlorobiales bacterium]|nr:cell division protein FtsA [Chlorobiales bacterium]